VINNRIGLRQQLNRFAQAAERNHGAFTKRLQSVDQDHLEIARERGVLQSVVHDEDSRIEPLDDFDAAA